MSKFYLNPLLTSEYRNDLCTLAAEAIFDQDDNTGLQYLNKRGVSEESICKFGIGYCPIHSGVSGFAGMIIVPYRDAYGEIIAVTARNIEKTDGMTWWHESFDKPNHLFGLHLAYKHIHQQNACIMVEGQMDVIALHQRGIENAVAICGSALSLRQMWMIARYCDNMYLLFDTDVNNSGQKSAKSAMAKMQFLKGSDGQAFGVLNMYNASLPMGYDADEYVRKQGAESLKGILKNAEMEYASQYEEIDRLIGDYEE